MNSNGKSNANWMYIFSIASVWFGTHVGGGFASGRQTMTFFVSYGWYAIFLPAIAMILVGLTYREQLIVAKNHRAFDYNSMSHKLYAPYDNFMSPVYEVCNIMAGFLAISASIAGGASLLQEIFDMPFMVAIVLLGIGVLLLAKFGSTLVRRVSTLLTLIIVFAFVVLCTKGISMQSSQLNEIVAAKQATAGFGSALWKAITYAGFQCFAFMGLLSSARDIQDTPTITKSMVIGYILNASMITLTAVLLVAWIPQLTEQPLPILFIAQQMGTGWLVNLYSVALLAAFTSTAVSATFGTISRFTALREKTSKTGIFADEKTFSTIVGVAVIAISVFISTFGLIKIVAVGYGYAGYAGVFLVIIPTLTYGHWKNKQYAKQNPESDNVTSI